MSLFHSISTVSPTPTDFDYIRQLTSVQLSWTSSPLTPRYQLLITNRAGVETNDFTTNNELVLTLQLDDEYTIKLVDTGGDLPSEVLNVTVPQGKYFDLFVAFNILPTYSCQYKDRGNYCYAT